jgi:signal transduction histidine kinase
MDSKPGTAVRWLPIGLTEQDESVAIELPCPATDLIRLVATCHDPGAIRALLRLNPALMLYALSGFYRVHRRSADSAKQLLSWCKSDLAQSLGELELGTNDLINPPKVSQTSADEFFETYLRARSNRKLRISLCRFLRLYVGSSKSESKKLVQRLVGKKILAQQFKCKRVRRRSTLDHVVKNWRRRSGVDADIARLFRLARASFESDSQFAQRLHDEKLASMKQLAYGASHEINNPLANISTRAQTLLAIEDDAEKRHKLAVIYQQAMRAHEMISDMMLFAHPPGLNQERVSVRMMMSRIFKELKPDLQESSDVGFTITVAAGVDQADVDQTQIGVAIRSLIQNSLESLRGSQDPDKRVDVRIDRNGSQALQIAVWDNGTEISDEVARHMFDPFYSGREAGRGLGFGLSKAWTIARLHGGSLKYDGDSKTGTRFLIAIPVVSTDLEIGPPSILSIRKNRTCVEDEAA